MMQKTKSNRRLLFIAGLPTGQAGDSEAILPWISKLIYQL